MTKTPVGRWVIVGGWIAGGLLAFAAFAQEVPGANPYHGNLMTTVRGRLVHRILQSLSVLLMVVRVSWAVPAWAEGPALARAKERGFLISCVDPFNPPFSSHDPGSPGFDVEIAQEIAQILGFRVSYFWADTGTRGGLGRALRTSILQHKCDFFMGMPTGKEVEEEFREKGLELSRPYFGTGYVLVVREGGLNAQRLEALKGKKIAVGMVSAADGYLFYRGYDREIYRNVREALVAMEKGEAEVALLWAPRTGWWLKQHPESKLKLVEGYIPEPELRWNLAIAVREEDRDLKEAINQAIDRLVRAGQIRQILTRYGVPFYPPFE